MEEKIEIEPRLCKISMVGEHQIQNASVALAVFYRWMRENGHTVDEEKVDEALEHTKWQARMERIKEDPPIVYIDGAHNPAGLTALRQMLEKYYPEKDITVIYSGITSKDQTSQVDILLDMDVEKIVFTTFERRNAVPISTFKRLVSKKQTQEDTHLPEIEFHNSWQKYLKYELETQKDNPDSLILVVGSLYFAAQVRQYMLY